MARTYLIRQLAAACVVLAAVVALVLVAVPAKAVPSLEASRFMAAAGLQTFESFTVTCATTATPIVPTTGVNFGELYCENNSSTSVFYGGAATDGLVTTSNSPCISTTSASCLRSAFSMSVARGKAACIVASGTVVIKCLGGT